MRAGFGDAVHCCCFADSVVVGSGIGWWIRSGMIVRDCTRGYGTSRYTLVGAICYGASLELTSRGVMSGRESMTSICGGRKLLH